MNTSKLVKRYTDYRQKNAQIKLRQKKEREAELKPFLEDIGREVAALRSEGMSVVDQAEAVTNKNRNFLYGALKAFDLLGLEVVDEPLVEFNGWEDPTYFLMDNGNSVDVKIYWHGGDENVSLYLSDGVVDDYPEHWIMTTNADRKAFYKRLIAEVERAAAEK